MGYYTPQRSAEDQSGEARKRAARAKDAEARKKSLAALARLKAIEDEWERNPGSAPGGTGLTGLGKNDSRGYSDMLNRQTEGLNLQRELAGQRPMDLEVGGGFDDEPEPDRYQAAQARSAAQKTQREQNVAVQRQTPSAGGGAGGIGARAPQAKPAGAKYGVEIELPGSEYIPERIDATEERAYRAQLEAAASKAKQAGRMADPDYARAEGARQGQTDLTEFQRNAPKQAGVERQITIDDLRALAPVKRQMAADDAGAQVNDPQLRGLSDLLFGRQKELAGLRGQSHGGSRAAGGANPKELSAIAQSVLDGTILMDDLTPTVRGKIAAELGAGDFKRSAKLSGGQRESIADMETLQREAGNVKGSLDKGLQTGWFDTAVHQARELFGGAKDFTKYNSSLSNMNSALLKLRSGAAVSDQEFARIRGYIPLQRDDEKTAATKTAKFIEEMEKVRQNYVKRATQSAEQVRDSVTQKGNTGAQGGEDALAYLDANGYEATPANVAKLIRNNPGRFR